MIDLYLQRVSSTEYGVFGVLLDALEIPFSVTAELPDLGNQVGISCIPMGRYLCKRVMYNRGGYETFEITDVTGRTHILFHKGNVPTEDAKGCVLIGELFEPVHGKPAIQQSGKGFKEFMKMFEGRDEFTLVIY